MSPGSHRLPRLLACAGAVWCLAAGPATRPAAAAELAIGLAYDVPAECPDVDAFKAIVIGQIGRDPFSDLAPDRVTVRIVQRGRALDGRLEWRDAGGTWAGDQSFPLVTADCPRLTRAIGFALAVQIQLLATGEARPAPAAEPAARPAPSGRPPAAPAPPTPPAAPPPAPPPAAVRHVGPELLLGGGPSVAVGLSAGPVLLGRLFAGWAWPHASIELAALVSLPATVRRADGAGFSQQQLLLGVAGCALVTRWRFCLLANAGEVRLAGADIDRPTSAVVPAVQAGARVAAAQPVGGRAFVSAHLDGLALLSRWTGTLDRDPVWTAPRFAAALGVDAGLRFP